MCGITGILDPYNRVESSEIRSFTAALEHRGPDAMEIHVDENAALGHTRLAILDLSDLGKCPMPFGGADGKRYWITFNGEIFNFLELRSELESDGVRFRSQTDTEVIVAAYAKWGPACLTRFNGMWAFAIWDSVERRMFLSRDRFGIKPLYYRYSGRLEFASEIKAWLSLPGFTKKLNQDAALVYLTDPFHFEGKTTATLLSGIEKLPAGHCLTIEQNGEPRITKWWNTADNLPSIPDNYRAQVERFKEIFEDAVRIRMRSDVPVATCLSGGIDSSAVACTMAKLQGASQSELARCTKDWQRTFIATFPGTMLDEREYADAVVRKIGAKPTYWTFDDQTALDTIVDSVWSLEDGLAGIVTPVWCIYRTLRQNKVVVSLDGHGADELLGGYAWYLDEPSGTFNERLYRDFHTTILPGILRNFDRCSMAHGIEVRMPFMDWRLVTYAMALPPDSKMGGGFTKRILRDATADVLPDVIRNRRSKIGFNSPMIEWLNGGLGNLIDRVTSHHLWLESPYFNGKQLREQILTKCRTRSWTKDDWHVSLQVWSLVSFTIWQMLFIENQSGATLRGTGEIPANSQLLR